MKNYTVSILVPIYGVERFIERCARSLFEQTYDSIEFVFVNDCTKDRSIEILQRTIEDYPSRKYDIILIQHPHNMGLAMARNTALENAHGDYILHVDSDDTLDLDCVRKLVEKATSENADIVVGDMNLVFGETKYLLERPLVNSKSEYIQRLLDWGSIELSIVAKLIRKSLYEQAQIRCAEHVDFGEDFSITPRLVYHANQVVFLNEAIYNYDKTNEASYSGRQLSDKHAMSLVNAAKIVYSFFESRPEASLYEKAIMSGKAKIKCFILKALSPETRKKYCRLYPELDNYKGLSFYTRVRLFFIKYNMFCLLRIYEKINRCFL